jgi:hypothetical protein
VVVESISLEPDVDVAAVARRVVARLRPSDDLKDDLLQQAVVEGIDLLRRFHPRSGPGQPSPRDQAERYLYVSLQWNLRTYARRLRSSISIHDSDRRLIAAFHRLAETQANLSVEEAAHQLGVRPTRLAAALRASDFTISLDQPTASDDRDDGLSLSQRLAAEEPSPEEALIATIDEQQAMLRQSLLDTTTPTASGRSSHDRLDQIRHIVLLLLEQLGHGEAEIIRLSFALPRKELNTIRSCRAYGCRQERGHRHEPVELARWLHADPNDLARRLDDGIDSLRELLGGRDPRRLLHAVSLGAASASPTGSPQRSTRRRTR